jgi:hypothetical protein
MMLTESEKRDEECGLIIFFVGLEEIKKWYSAKCDLTKIRKRDYDAYGCGENLVMQRN